MITNLEFERLSNTAGPTGGKIVLRDGETAPQTVGIIHCVGSRDKKYNIDCSAICCMQSLKFAHLVKEKTGAKVYNFYIDIRTPGKTYDEFYQRILDEGVHFVRGKVADVTDAARLPGRRRQTDHSGRRHARGQADPHPGGHGRPLRRDGAARTIRKKSPRNSASRAARTVGSSNAIPSSIRWRR